MRDHSENIFYIKLLMDAEKTDDPNLISQKLKEFFNVILLPRQIISLVNLENKPRKSKYSLSMKQIF